MNSIGCQEKVIKYAYMISDLMQRIIIYIFIFINVLCLLKNYNKKTGNY